MLLLLILVLRCVLVRPLGLGWVLAEVVLEVLLGGEWVDIVGLRASLHLFLQLVHVGRVAGGGCSGVGTRLAPTSAPSILAYRCVVIVGGAVPVHSPHVFSLSFLPTSFSL